MIALLLLIAGLEPGSAPTSGPTVEIGVAEVLERIERFDPTVKVKAYEQLRAEILLRRAQWNQVSGTVGLNAQYGIYGTQLLPAGARWCSPGEDPELSSCIVANRGFDRLNANLTAQITYPIYAGYGIQGAIDAAGSRLDAARLDRRVVTRDLKRAALVALAQLMASERQLAISQLALERSDAIASVAERRKASGISTEADVARTALNRLRRAEELETRSGERGIAEAVLRAALMLETDVHIVPRGDIAAVREVGAARDNPDRLELSSLRAQVQAAHADAKVAFAGWLPRLEAFGTASYGNGSPFFIGGTALGFAGGTQRLGYFSGSATAGLRLSWTGWDFFVTRDNVARAEADRSITEMRLAEQERTVRREREEAKARVLQAERRLAALEGTREVAARAVRLARARYETGNAVLTEVLDAELEAISVESRQVQADYDAAAAHLDRLRAEGAEL